MKKKILVTLGGVFFGVLLMIGIFSILNLRPSNENVSAQVNMKKDVLANKEIIEIASAFTSESFGYIKEQADILAESDALHFEETETEEPVEETTDEPIAEVEKPQSGATTAPAKHPYYIKVNRLANCVTVYTLDEEGNYTVPIKAMTCSVGTNWSTPLGVSKISDKYVWRLLFGNTYGHYSVRFNGHILFHSVPYMSPTNDTLKEGQFNLLGQPASQGCIRLCVADAKWIYDNCAKGTIVEVYDSENPGPLGKPGIPKIHSYSPYGGWDPTDPNPSNPWRYGSVMIYGAADRILNAGESLDLLSGVTASDVDGMAIAVQVSGGVDFNTAGTYQVTYSATGVLGHTATQTVNITVMAVEQPVNSGDTEVIETPETESSSTEMAEPETPSTEISDTEVPEIQSTEVPIEN